MGRITKTTNEFAPATSGSIAPEAPVDIATLVEKTALEILQRHDADGSVGAHALAFEIRNRFERASGKTADGRPILNPVAWARTAAYHEWTSVARRKARENRRHVSMDITRIASANECDPSTRLQELERVAQLNKWDELMLSGLKVLVKDGGQLYGYQSYWRGEIDAWALASIINVETDQAAYNKVCALLKKLKSWVAANLASADEREEWNALVTSKPRRPSPRAKPNSQVVQNHSQSTMTP